MGKVDKGFGKNGAKMTEKKRKISPIQTLEDYSGSRFNVERKKEYGNNPD